MKVEFIRWLCEGLGLPLVEESVNGSIFANAVAQEALQDVPNYKLISAINRLVGNRADPATLEAKAAKARKGGPQAYPVGDEYRVLLVPLEQGRVCAIVAPAGLSAGASAGSKALASKPVAAISHELANAVGAIAGWARLAREGKRAEEAVELIEKASLTALSIARQLLGQAAADNEPPGIDLSALADEAARLLAPRAIQQGINITRNIFPALRVRGARDNLWSVVWNPMLNSVEAMPRGGALSVEVSGSGDRVNLVIQDNGPGMDEKTRARVFQPYFTTKRAGTGLGLALVKQAVEEMEGSIELTSAPGSGTRLRIELPLYAAEAGGPPPRVSGVSAARLSGRILVVEDDPAMRDMMLTALAARGAEVVGAATAGEALRAEGRFDLALADIRLPDGSGESLLAELCAAGKVGAGLLVTGSEISPDGAPQTRPYGLLRKPFQLEDLFERVAGLLNPQARLKRAAG